MRRLLLALALLAPFPGAASAAVVDAYPGDQIDDGVVSVTDTRGQRNSLTVSGHNGVATITERGATGLRAGHGCHQRAARRVTCGVLGDYSYRLEAYLGAGDDSLAVADRGGNFYGVEVEAGAGNDHVALTTPFGALAYGGPGRDSLRGSGVADYMQGGTGRDRLFGRGGADVLVGDTTGPRWAASDMLDGGSGRDTASWEGRTRPVHVDLAARVGGQRGERDVLRRVENASGGVGSDRLLGDRGGNVLWGGPGADRLDGRAGNDALDAGPDTVVSSYGEDGTHDRLGCGPGRDTVYEPGRAVFPRGCELLSTGAYAIQSESIHAQPRSSAGAASVETLCPRDVDGCTRRVTLRSQRRVLGTSTSRSLGTGEHAWIRVPLDRPLPSGTPIEIVVTGVNAYGDDLFDYSLTWRVRR